MKLFFYLQNLREKNQLNTYDLIYVYMFGGLLGTIYEEIYYFIISGKFVNSSGSVFLPFNIVYGAGILLVTICFYKVKNWLLIWLYSGLLCGLVEYIMSLISELCLNAYSWYYPNSIMTIDGRTTIPYMVIWGLGGMIILTMVIPFFIKLIHKIPTKPHKIISIVCLILIATDLVVSFYALVRYTQRHYGININNPISIWFDEIFNDKFMKEKYPNFHFINE